VVTAVVSAVVSALVEEPDAEADADADDDALALPAVVPDTLTAPAVDASVVPDAPALSPQAASASASDKIVATAPTRP
jgi:hypothetical protein